MDTSYTFSTSKELARKGFWAAMRHPLVHRPMRSAVLLALYILVVAIATVYVSRSGGVTPFPLAVALIIPLIGTKNLHDTWMKRHRERFGPTTQQVRASVTEQGLTLTLGQGAFTVKWSDIVCVLKCPDVWVVLQHGGANILLPCREMSEHFASSFDAHFTQQTRDVAPTQ